MALINRIGRLFQADFHAVLDRIEEPEIQLRQAIREMTFEVQQNEQRLTRLKEQATEGQKRHNEWELQFDALAEELDLCFSADNEQLVRDTIKRKLEFEKRLISSQHCLRRLEQSAKSLGDILNDQRAKLQSMSQKRDVYSSQHARHSQSRHSDETTDFTVRSEDIEIALLREKQLRAAS